MSDPKCYPQIVLLVFVTFLLTACLGQPVSTVDDTTATETQELIVTGNGNGAGSVSTSSSSTSTSNATTTSTSPFDVVPVDDPPLAEQPVNPAVGLTVDYDSGIRLTGVVSSWMHEQKRFTIQGTLVDVARSPRYDDGNEYDLANGKCVEVRGYTSNETGYGVVIASRIKFTDGYCE